MKIVIGEACYVKDPKEDTRMSWIRIQGVTHDNQILFEYKKTGNEPKKTNATAKMVVEAFSKNNATNDYNDQIGVLRRVVHGDPSIMKEPRYMFLTIQSLLKWDDYHESDDNIPPWIVEEWWHGPMSWGESYNNPNPNPTTTMDSWFRMETSYFHTMDRERIERLMEFSRTSRSPSPLTPPPPTLGVIQSPPRLLDDSSDHSLLRSPVGLFHPNTTESVPVEIDIDFFV